MKSCLSGLLRVSFDFANKISRSQVEDIPTKFTFSSFFEIVLMVIPACGVDGHKDLLEESLATIERKYVPLHLLF